MSGWCDRMELQYIIIHNNIIHVTLVILCNEFTLYIIVIFVVAHSVLMYHITTNNQSCILYMYKIK